MRRPSIVIGLGVAVLVGVTAFLAVHHDTSNAMVRTLMVGQSPTLIAIDSRTARAFVLDQGSGARNSGGGIVAGTIRTLDTRTGALVRTAPAGTGPNDVAVDEQTGRAFVLNSYMHNGGQGTVTVLDARSGQIVRTTPVGDAPFAVDLDASAGRVFVLNAPDGAVRWHARYALVSVLDATSGRLVGGLNPAPGDGQGVGPVSLALDTPRRRAFLTVGGPRGGTVIDVFDTHSDALVRRVPLGVTNGVVTVSATTGRAFVFEDKRVLVLDSARGRIIRVIRHPIDGQPIGDERTGRVFVAEQGWNVTSPTAPNWGRTEAGTLHVLDARTAASAVALPIEWPDGVAIDEYTGQLLVGHAGPKRSDGTFMGVGHVDVRDGRTGRLLRDIPVGVGPGAIAVDPRTGQALVVNEGGAIRVVDAWGWVPTWLRQHIPMLPPPPAPVRQVPSSVSVIALNR